jgi:hypothetical protein
VLGPLPDPQEMEGAIELESPLAKVLEDFETLRRGHLHVIVTGPDGEVALYSISPSLIHHC